MESILIPTHTWKEYETVIKNVGMNQKLSPTNKSDINKYNFLHSLGLLVKDETQEKTKYSFTEIGTEYYGYRYCTNQHLEADNIINNILSESEPARLLIQTLWGKANITKENCLNLLIHHKYIIDGDNLGTYLFILNQFGIITYSKKTNKVRIISEPKDATQQEDYFVDKSKPYSNLLKIKSMIRDANGNITWFEKHFSSKMYELISNYADGNNINTINILTGPDHINQVTRDEFKRLKEELSNKEIKISHKIILEKKYLNSIHGRWFITDKYIYNIPPINTILQGQSDEIILRKEKPHLEEIDNQSVDIITNWDEIIKYMGEKNE